MATNTSQNATSGRTTDSSTTAVVDPNRFESDRHTPATARHAVRAIVDRLDAYNPDGVRVRDIATYNTGRVKIELESGTFVDTQEIERALSDTSWTFGEMTAHSNGRIKVKIGSE